MNDVIDLDARLFRRRIGKNTCNDMNAAVQRTELNTDADQVAVDHLRKVRDLLFRHVFRMGIFRIGRHAAERLIHQTILNIVDLIREEPVIRHDVEHLFVFGRRRSGRRNVQILAQMIKQTDRHDRSDTPAKRNRRRNRHQQRKTDRISAFLLFLLFRHAQPPNTSSGRTRHGAFPPVLSQVLESPFVCQPHPNERLPFQVVPNVENSDPLPR